MRWAADRRLLGALCGRVGRRCRQQCQLLGELAGVAAAAPARYRCVLALVRDESDAPRCWPPASGRADCDRARRPAGVWLRPAVHSRRTAACRRAARGTQESLSHRGKAAVELLRLCRHSGECLARCRRYRCTCIFPGVCANARTAISIRTRCMASCRKPTTSMRCSRIWRSARRSRVARSSACFSAAARPACSSRRPGAAAGGAARAARVGRRYRDHAGSQPGHDRARPLRRLSRRRHQSRVAGCAELCRCGAAAARPHPCGRGYAARGGGAALAGIDNFNLDLMYGLPEPGPCRSAGRHRQRGAARADTYVALPADPGAGHRVRRPAAGGTARRRAALDMQLACQQRLAQAGYAQYEVSAYARSGSAATI